MSSRENTTDNHFDRNNTTLFVRWKHWNWIVPETVNLVLMALTLWILYTLIRYGNISKKWISKNKRDFEKLNAGFVLMAAVLCAVASFLRLVNSQVVINIGYSYKENNQCEMVSDASVIMFGLSTLTVYIYLWVRQSVFYRNQMLNTDFSKALKFFSYLSIILIFFGGLASVLINTVYTSYLSTPTGCIYKSNGSSLDLLIVVVGSLVSLLGQGTLVSLYVYPLYRHNKRNKSSKFVTCGCLSIFGNDSNNQQGQASPREVMNHRKKQTANKINTIMCRTVVFSIAIVVANISFLLLITYVFAEDDNRRLPTMIYDLATFLNLIFVVSSFVGWKTIVFPSLPNSISFTFQSSRGTNPPPLSYESRR